MEEQRNGAPFWQGLLVGVGLAAAALALTAGLVTRRGVEVAVQTAEITGRLEREVESAVRQELPAALAQVKSDLPRQVAAEAGRRLAEARIELGGFDVPMPGAVVQQVEQAVGKAMQAGLDAAVRRVDVDGLATRMGDRTAQLADQRLREFLAAQVIAVEVAPGFRVPVRLVPR